MKDEDIIDFISKLNDKQCENNKLTLETLKNINKNNCIRDVLIILIVASFLLILYVL